LLALHRRSQSRNAVRGGSRSFGFGKLARWIATDIAGYLPVVLVVVVHARTALLYESRLGEATETRVKVGGTAVATAAAMAAMAAMAVIQIADS